MVKSIFLEMAKNHYDLVKNSNSNSSSIVPSHNKIVNIPNLLEFNYDGDAMRFLSLLLNTLKEELNKNDIANNHVDISKLNNYDKKILVF